MTDHPDPPSGGEVLPWRPELTEAIYALLYRDDLWTYPESVDG